MMEDLDICLNITGGTAGIKKQVSPPARAYCNICLHSLDFYSFVLSLLVSARG